MIGQQKVGPSGHDKTSILVSTRNEPGALYKILEPFHRHDISLDPDRNPAGPLRFLVYVFFIDFRWPSEPGEHSAVLTEVAEVAMEVRSLGSYPQAVI